MATIERRLETLEAKVPHTNGLSQRTEYWSEDDLFACLRCGDLRFEGAGNVTIGPSIGRSTTYYDFLADLAMEMNRIYSQGLPGAILVPLTPAQVEAALVTLDAGEFRVSMSSNYGPCKATYTGIGARWHAAKESSELAHIVSGALRCFIAQLPGDVCKEDFQSLEGLRWMLDWCRIHFDEVNDDEY